MRKQIRTSHECDVVVLTPRSANAALIYEAYDVMQASVVALCAVLFAVVDFAYPSFGWCTILRSCANIL